MYGPLLLVIIAAGVIIVGSVIVAISKKLELGYFKWKSTEPRKPIKPWYFEPYTSKEAAAAIEAEFKSDLEQYEINRQKHAQRKPKIDGLPEGIFWTAVGGIVIAIGVLVIAGTITLCDFFHRRQQLSEWKEKYEMIQLVEESGSEAENVALSQTKIEFNTWLSEARASLDYYGNWSGYYFVKDEIKNLNYLT